MSENKKQLSEIPGLEMVGRGIYIRPRQTFELKPILFHRDRYRVYSSRETGQDYRVPEGYEVNDSPPMPATQALSRMMIEESWERFEKQTSVDVAVSTGNAPFSVDVNASQMGLGSASTNMGRQQAKEKLQNNSECTVFGKGGNELTLATLSSLDEARYNEWVITIKDNPQLIEFDACGIWTLIDDVDKANALRDAYIRETVFTPVQAVLNLDGRVHVFRGKTCFSYNPDMADASPSAPVKDAWPMLADVGFEQVDAAFLGKYLTASTGEELSRKIYFFNRDKYIRVDVDARVIDDGYPKSIADGWPGVPFKRVDAALNVSGESVYFFLGKQYVRFDVEKHRVDDGYPMPIAERWAGLNFDRVDAAVYWGNGKVYFFRDNQHIRYDTVNYCIDPGYPKFIFGNYFEDWKFFD